MYEKSNYKTKKKGCEEGKLITVELTQRELDMYHIDLPNVPYANEDRTVYNTDSNTYNADNNIIIIIIIIINIVIIITYNI